MLEFKAIYQIRTKINSKSVKISEIRTLITFKIKIETIIRL
jgi:hypothetical protein